MKHADPAPAEHPIDEAARLAGGRPALARQLGVTLSAIGNYKARGVPEKVCVRIERIAPQVTRQRLRPADWHEIWPELAGPSTTQKAA